MSIRKYLLTTFFILFVIFLPQTFVYADVAPKESVTVTLTYNHEAIPDVKFYAQLFSCDSLSTAQLDSKQADTIDQLRIIQFDPAKNCYWHPAPHVFGGNCSQSLCDFGYFPPHVFKLAVYLPSLNIVFISDELTRKAFYSSYTADLSLNKKILMSGESGSFPKEKIYNYNVHPDNTNYTELFIGALILTEILELFTTLIFVFIAKVPQKRKALVFVLLANIISLPVVWFLFPLLHLESVIRFVLSETFAVLFEAYFLYFFLKKTLSLKKALILSLFNNLISMFIGFTMFS